MNGSPERSVGFKSLYSKSPARQCRVLYFVHPTVLTTFGDVQFIPDVVEASPSRFAFPDVGEGPLIDISVTKPWILQVRAAAVHLAVSHDGSV